MADSPPTAADFWGERSASIHDALQVRADDEIDAPPHPPAVLPARRGRRAAFAASLALAVATAVALAFGLTGSSPREAGGPKANVAAVLSTTLSRLLAPSLAQVDVRAASTRATVAHHVGGARRTPRRRPVLERAHQSARYQTSPPVSYAASASADVSPPPAVTTPHQPTLSAGTGGTSAATSPATRPAEPAVRSHASRSSGAAVSPTGESGALGPLQSPNG